MVEIISELLSVGLQESKNSISMELLPSTKDIILIMTRNLTLVDVVKKTNTNYYEHFINSTSGKVLKVLMNYSLRNAEVRGLKNELVRWEDDIRTSLNNLLEKDIIGMYFLEGRYFYQLLFLDREWLTENIKSILEMEDDKWLPFLEGLCLSNSPENKEKYY